MCPWNMAAGDRTIAGEIDLRSNIVASRCPDACHYSLCKHSSLVLHAKLPACPVCLSNVDLHSFLRASQRNTIGIRPGTGGDQISPRSYRVIRCSGPVSFSLSRFNARIRKYFAIRGFPDIYRFTC